MKKRILSLGASLLLSSVYIMPLAHEITASAILSYYAYVATEEFDLIRLDEYINKL